MVKLKESDTGNGPNLARVQMFDDEHAAAILKGQEASGIVGWVKAGSKDKLTHDVNGVPIKR